MADAILHGGFEFGGAGVARGVEENRVVAEAAMTARCFEDAPVPAAFGDQRCGIFGMAQQDDDA